MQKRKMQKRKENIEEDGWGKRNVQYNKGREDNDGGRKQEGKICL